LFGYGDAISKFMGLVKLKANCENP